MKENAFTHYTRDNTLYNRLLDAASDDKLPLLDNKSFELLNKTYGKDKMRTHLADYIASERPVFPLKEITKDDMRKCFYDLKKFDTSSICGMQLGPVPHSCIIFSNLTRWILHALPGKSSKTFSQTAPHVAVSSFVYSTYGIGSPLKI